MVYRLFVDLETTGPITSKYADIIEIHAELHVNGSKTKEFNDKYSYTPSTVFVGGMNRNKAERHKKEGYKSSKEGLVDFIKWLDTNLGKNKAFLVSYNCAFDNGHLKNWFWRSGKDFKYFYDPCICVMSLCSCRYDKWLKLSDCAINLGIQVEESSLHTAIYDNNLNVQVYSKLSKSLRA